MYEMMLSTIGDQATYAAHGLNYGANVIHFDTHILDVTPSDYFQIQGLINYSHMLDIVPNHTWAMVEILE